jgi:hypothetical protein
VVDHAAVGVSIGEVVDGWGGGDSTGHGQASIEGGGKQSPYDDDDDDDSDDDDSDYELEKLTPEMAQSLAYVAVVRQKEVDKILSKLSELVGSQPPTPQHQGMSKQKREKLIEQESAKLLCSYVFRDRSGGGFPRSPRSKHAREAERVDPLIPANEEAWPRLRGSFHGKADPPQLATEEKLLCSQGLYAHVHVHFCSTRPLHQQVRN